MPVRDSILQVWTCKIFSIAENPRWSRVWQYCKIQVTSKVIPRIYHIKFLTAWSLSHLLARQSIPRLQFCHHNLWLPRLYLYTYSLSWSKVPIKRSSLVCRCLCAYTYTSTVFGKLVTLSREHESPRRVWVMSPSKWIRSWRHNAFERRRAYMLNFEEIDTKLWLGVEE